MSLLLDALKKAAADKEKNSPVTDAIDSEAEKKATEDYPAIDETLIEEELIVAEDTDQHKKNEAIEQEEDLDLDLPDETTGPDVLELEQSESILEPEPELHQQKIPEKKAVKIEESVEKNLQAGPGNSSEVITNTKAKSIDVPVPEKHQSYDHSDARKILGVAQKRYRNKQRLGYYGLYVFAALLFFSGSYFYYTTEILDNSDRPVFKAKNNSSTIPRSPKEIKIEKQVSIAKAKLAEMDVAESKQAKVIVPEKKKQVVARKQQASISIIKQKKEDPISLLLFQAYEKYQAGHYDLSNALYQRVLVRDTRQHDALLGVAAIAVVKKDYSLARGYYQRILRFYPRDSIAESALVDLARQELTVANESQLKSLKRDDPKAAHIYFSLGLLYAKKNRIKESQQAFFDAYALDKRADYAYNLAVMLDKLGQPKAALSYYKQASDLSDTSTSHFNEKLALDRISQLESE